MSGATCKKITVVDTARLCAYTLDHGPLVVASASAMRPAAPAMDFILRSP
jgi:hypothetical protein